MIPNEPSYDRYAEVVTPIWGGLAAIHRKPPGPRKLRIRWFRVLGAVTGLASISWLMIAVGLYFWFKLGRGFVDEKFQDVLLLPFHWPPFHSAEHDRKMGEYFLQTANYHLEHNHLEEAFKDYRLAVMKMPENLEARTHYSDFIYASEKNLDKYFSLLEDGLPYALADDPNHYIDNYFVNLRQSDLPDRSDRIEKICRQYLAQNLANPKTKAIFALNLVNVLIDRGDYDEAEKILKDPQYQLQTTLDGVMLYSRLLWEKQELQEAVAYVKGNLARFDNNDYLLGLLSLYCRNMGDMSQALAYLSEREIKNPGNVLPRIERLNIDAKSGDTVRLQQEINDIITQFQNNPSAMTALGNYAANQGDVTLALRLYDLVQQKDRALRIAAQKSGYSVADFALLVVQTYLAAHRYNDALLFLDQLRQDKPDWLAPNQLVFDSMRAVADSGIGDDTDAEMYVNTLVNSANARPDVLLHVAGRFIAHGSLPLAQRLLDEAHRLDPHNQAILTDLISVNLQLGNSENMDANLRSLMQTNRPNAELLYDAYRQLSSDHYIFVPDREKLLAELGTYLNMLSTGHTPDESKSAAFGSESVNNAVQ